MPDGSTKPLASLPGWDVRKPPLCALWWAGLPLVTQRLSKTHWALTLDSLYLAASPALGALASTAALLAGVPLLMVNRLAAEW